MTHLIRRVAGVSAILVCVTMAPVGAASPQESQADRIEHRVHADASLKAQDIKIAVDDGVVTLTGRVATSAQKARAGRLARVKGITRVDNQLEVKSSKSVAARTAEK